MATLSPAAARIIGQLRNGQAFADSVGLGGPAMDDAYETLIRQITDAPDPKSRMREIAALLADHARSGRPVGGAR
ncbi:hypothetical protein ABZX77_17810 [Streptomyces sp. NPDC004237]|uniref:hypothetical protein n=1 Tax=Streptomyces sp. NPDC004237 TaxID=3154455 RepID=UPI0033B43EA7